MSPKRRPMVAALYLAATLLIAPLGLAPTSATTRPDDGPSEANAQGATGRLMFIENAGQWPDAARYGVRFGPSGWELAWDTTGLAPGVHRL